MESLDAEIEFLDEDAEILQQYGIAQTEETYLKVSSKTSQHRERSKRKRPVYERDDDYVPKLELPKKQIKKNRTNYSAITPKKTQIPDLEDSLYLPVKILQKDLSNIRTIHKWNMQCLKAYETFDEPLVPLGCKANDKITSTKTIVLRKVKSKVSDKLEDAVCSKIEVKSSKGHKNKTVFNGILPKFVDNQNPNYKLYDPPKKTGNMILSHNTVILTQENKDLVVYNPGDRLSHYYRFTEKSKIHEGKKVQRRYLEEVDYKNVCTSCYQCQGTDSSKINSASCAICGERFTSIYSMVSHLRNHDQRQVRAKRNQIAQALNRITQYTYKCRICQEKFSKMQLFKKHLATHGGKTLFKCDIGNHVTK